MRKPVRRFGRKFLKLLNLWTGMSGFTLKRGFFSANDPALFWFAIGEKNACGQYKVYLKCVCEQIFPLEVEDGEAETGHLCRGVWWEDSLLLEDWKFLNLTRAERKRLLQTV